MAHSKILGPGYTGNHHKDSMKKETTPDKEAKELGDATQMIASAGSSGCVFGTRRNEDSGYGDAANGI